MAMTTIVQQIQQEIGTLPDDGLQEVLDFVRFLKSKKQTQQTSEILNQPSEKLLQSSDSGAAKMQRDQWMASLSEMHISKKEQKSIAQARKEEGQAMTLEQFQTYLENADV